nr:molecular chaperone Tir [Epilithonimonas sp.]
MDFETVEKYILDLDYKVMHKSEETGVFVIENTLDGIRNLIVGIAPPVIIFEQYLFTINNDTMDMFKSLLMKNRDMIHGAFAITEDGKKVIFRYTL